MPLDKNMSHEEMVKELMASYEKNGKIGSTKPRDEKHALEIANAVAYNIEESNEVKEIDRKVKEMTLDEMLNKWEEFLSAKEKELGISEIEENPKVKVTLDSGETFETEVDPATSEDELEQQYKAGTEINVGKEGQERKARIKSATLTKQMGEEYEEEYHTCEWCGEEFPESEMRYEKNMGWLCDTCIRAIESRGEELEFDESFDTEYKEAENTLSKYFTNASDIMRVLDSQSEDQGVQGIKETLAKLQKLIDGETYHLSKTFRNTYTVFDTNSNPYLDFFIDDDEKIKFSELDLDESLEDNKYYDIFKNMDLDKEALQHSLKVLKANKKGPISQGQIDAIEKILKEDLENPPAVIENPTDVVSLDIPLLMRLLEWSREQAGEDVDLHVLTENLVEAMKDTEFLTMDDYERLVPCEECNDEEEPMGESFSEDRTDIEQTYGVDLSKNLKFNGLDEVPDEWSEFIEDSNYTFNNVQDLFKQQGYIIERVNEPTIETNYITFKVFKDQMGAKPTGVMEVTRVDLLKNNAYDIAYKIQRELEDRYPSILECDGSCATTSSDMGADQVLPFGKKNKVKKLKSKESNHIPAPRH